MADALRELLAEFVVSIDPNGDLAKGHAQIDALKAASEALEAKLRRLGEAAKPAANAIANAFASPALEKAMAQAGANSAANLFGNFGAAQGLDRADTAATGPQFGPTRETLQAGVKASAAYANSLRGQLASAFQTVGAAGRAAGSRIANSFRSIEQATRPGQDGVFDKLLTLKNGFAALAGGAAVRGAFGLLGQIGNIGEASNKLGVTTDEFQRLDVLAKQNSTSVEALGTAFRTLGKQAVDPTKDSAAAFAALGVQTKDASGFKSRNALFFETAGALADVTNETQRAQLAQQLFGRSGTELLPLLSQGRAGLEAQRAALEKMNVVSPEAIKQADEFGDKLEIVKVELLAKLTPSLIRLMPFLEKLTGLVVRGVDALAKFASRADFGGIAIVALAAKVNGLGGSAIKAGIQLARMLLPLLFLEDIIGFFNGDDSLTGRLMTWLFGDDAGAGIQKAAQDIKETLGEVFTGDFLGPSFSQIKKDLGEFFEFLDKSSFAAHGLLTAVSGLKTLFIDTPIAIGNSAASAAGLGAPSQQQTNNVTVNVGSTAEVAGAISGVQQGLNNNAAYYAAVGGL